MPKLGPPQFKGSSATWWKGGIKVFNLSPYSLFNHGRQSPLSGGLTSPESYESISTYSGPPTLSLRLPLRIIILPTYFSTGLLKTH